MGKQRRFSVEGMTEDVPAEVSEAAEKYLDAKRKKSKYAEAEKGAKSLLIEKMDEHNLDRILIDDEEKVLVRVAHDEVKIQAKKKVAAVGEEDDGE